MATCEPRFRSEDVMASHAVCITGILAVAGAAGILISIKAEGPLYARQGIRCLWSST